MVLTPCIASARPAQGVPPLIALQRRCEGATSDPRLDAMQAHKPLPGLTCQVWSIAGGSLDRCIEILRELESFTIEEREDRFSLYTWLAVAYHKKNDEARASAYASLARRVYPGNTWLEDLMSQ